MVEDTAEEEAVAEAAVEEEATEEDVVRLPSADLVAQAGSLTLFVLCRRRRRISLVSVPGLV